MTKSDLRIMVDESHVKARYKAAGQDHVFKYIDRLSVNEKDALFVQLDAINVEELQLLFGAAIAHQRTQESQITPFSKIVGKTADREEATTAYTKGIQAIGRGEVGALVLAGGQGSRLGFEGPKGMYDIGLPSGRTLFQLLSERLQRLRHIVAKSCASDTCDWPAVPFYIMTSPINHDETMEFFKSSIFFGLPESDVMFFEQGMLPCLTNEGKIIMETAGSVAMAPDGYVIAPVVCLDHGLLMDRSLVTDMPNLELHYSAEMVESTRR